MPLSRSEHDEISLLIAREIPSLRRYAQVLMKTSEGKDDLVQDTLERAIKKSHTWRREGNIKSWLYRIQYTLFLNRFRSPHLREVSTEEEMTGAEISAPAGQEESIECTRAVKAMNELPEHFRQTMALVSIEGFSYDEAAQIMDVPVGTVRSRLARARETLRLNMRNTMIAQSITGVGENSDS